MGTKRRDAKNAEREAEKIWSDEQEETEKTEAV